MTDSLSRGEEPVYAGLNKSLCDSISVAHALEQACAQAGHEILQSASNVHSLLRGVSDGGVRRISTHAAPWLHDDDGADATGFWVVDSLKHCCFVIARKTDFSVWHVSRSIINAQHIEESLHPRRLSEMITLTLPSHLMGLDNFMLLAWLTSAPAPSATDWSLDDCLQAGRAFIGDDNAALKLATLGEISIRQIRLVASLVEHRTAARTLLRANVPLPRFKKVTSVADVTDYITRRGVAGEHLAYGPWSGSVEMTMKKQTLKVKVHKKGTPSQTFTVSVELEYNTADDILCGSEHSSFKTFFAKACKHLFSSKTALRDSLTLYQLSPVKSWSLAKLPAQVHLKGVVDPYDARVAARTVNAVRLDRSGMTYWTEDASTYCAAPEAGAVVQHLLAVLKAKLPTGLDIPSTFTIHVND